MSMLFIYPKPKKKSMDGHLRKMKNLTKNTVAKLPSLWYSSHVSALIWYLGSGFDIDGKVCIPACGISPVFLGAKKNPRSEVSLYGRLGVHCFNIDKERKLQYMRIPKYNVQYPKAMSFHITVEVNDLADNSPHTLQTLVTRSFSRNGEDLRVSTGICRIKPQTPEGEICLVDEEAIDKFYRGVMPNFVSKLGADDDKLRFYEVQEQDICANDWLRLYTEFALFSYWRYNEDGFESCLPVEIKKIIVETCDTHREPRMKLKSSNAIFHINFNAKNCDYKSVLRRTTDGKPGHIFSKLIHGRRIIKLWLNRFIYYYYYYQKESLSRLVC
ncbi:putative protein MS5 [Arabidopsis thaliana]